MLDSTGLHIHRNIPCFVCEKTELGYDSYTPGYGHDGRALDIGSCMAPNDQKIANIEGARFFELCKGGPEDKLIVPKEMTLRGTSDPYHYGGMREPKFGERIGQTVFVCHFCSKYYGNDLARRVAILAIQALNEQFLNVLARCFRRRLFSLEPGLLKQGFRRLEKGVQNDLRTDINEFIEDLRALEQNSEIKEVLAKCRRIQKATSAKPKSAAKASVA